MPSKPTAQRDQIAQLWDDIRGEDGGGVKELAEKNHTAISIMQVDIAEIKGMLKGHVETARPPAKIITLKRIIEAFVAVLAVGFVVAFVFLIIGGKLTAEDIAHILEAWKGTP